MRKAFDWKRSIISMLEVEAVPQSCIPQVQMDLSIVVYEKFVACGEFWLASNKLCSLVRVITSCLRFVKMCLCQVSLLARFSPKYSLLLQ
jgi:hypothetical protein